MGTIRAMLNRLRSAFGLLKGPSPTAPQSGGSKGGKGGTAGLLPTPVDPVVKPKQASLPSYATRTVANTAALQRPDAQLANNDIVSLSRTGTTSDVIRALVKGNPDLSAALSAHLRMGLPEKYICFARDPDGAFNVDATRLVLQVLRRFDTMPGYDVGFNPTGSIRSTCEALAKEIIIEGGAGLELVLDQSRLPVSLSPVSVSPATLRFYDDWKGATKTLRPVQVIGGTEIDLDIPNFFMVWLDPSLKNAYFESPFESAQQPVLAAQSFLNDLRRLCVRHVYPRYDVSIDLEKLKPFIPQEVMLDEKKYAAYLNQTFEEVRSAIDGLGVDEALVHYSFATVEFIKGQDGDVPNTFETVKSIYDAKIATAAKSTSTIIGHGSGTANVASAETLIAMLTSNSMVRLKVQEILSKAMTLTARLFGHDVTCHFEFDEINLRPADEVEAFRTLKQDRIMKQVSLGYMLDEEACLRMTGNLPPAGFTVHWNTMFMDPAPALVDPNGNNYSGTGSGGGQSGGGASGQSRSPKTPTSNRGSKPAK